MAILGPLRIVKTTCPWCNASFLGPSAFRTLSQHIDKLHFDKAEEFKKMNKEEYTELTLSSLGLARKAEEDRMKGGEKDLEEAAIKEQEEKDRLATEKKIVADKPKIQIPFEPNKINIPLETVLEPTDWLTEFLQKFNVSEKFIIFQVEKLKITNKLPAPMDLETDLNELDSGSKGKRQNSYIRWFYENAIVDYKQKREAASLPFDQLSGISIEYQQPPKQIDFQRDRGFSVAEPPRQPFREHPSYSPSEKDELRLLRERLEQIEKEKYDALLQRNRDLELKFEQQRQPMQDPVIQRMEAKLEAIEQENRRLQGELSQQAQQNILTAVNEAKQMAANTPNIESIRQLVSQELERKEGKMTKEEIDQMIKNQIESKTAGISPEMVEIKKIDRQYDIEKAKLDADKSKGDMWGETIKSVAAIFGENLGKGLSATMGAQGPSPPQQQQYEQPPIQEQQQKVKTCPQCNKSMIFSLPDGITVGQCPYCSVPLEILPTGELAIYNFNPPVEIKKEQTAQVVSRPTVVSAPVEEPIGLCAGCGIKLYNHNIASTDIDGKQWCKSCSKG